MTNIKKSYVGLQWIKDAVIQRIHKPAYLLSSGTKAWYRNGKFHRDDGPAIEYSNGTKEWYIEGVCYTEEDYDKAMSK